MRVLVTVADYVRPDGYVNRMFVHTRNLYYLENGVDVTVLNFSAKEAYTVDGVPVISPGGYGASQAQYDVLVCHSPNIRNHYMFLKRYGHQFEHIVFVFHGHESLRLVGDYPKPYPWARKASAVGRLFQDTYDSLKLALWGRYFPKLNKKSRFVFVSDWLRERFLANTRIPAREIEEHSFVIPNSVGKFFEEASYAPEGGFDYDLITTRYQLDGAKYAVDVVNALAKSNPGLKFLVVGRGKFFSHEQKADNLDWVDATLTHDQMGACLKRARCALLPTRQDTQGVMACELATYGMPLITSDIPICREMLRGFRNVRFIVNVDTRADLEPLIASLQAGLPYGKVPVFFRERTTQREIALIRSLSAERDTAKGART